MIVDSSGINSLLFSYSIVKIETIGNNSVTKNIIINKSPPEFVSIYCYKLFIMITIKIKKVNPKKSLNLLFH